MSDCEVMSARSQKVHCSVSGLSPKVKIESFTFGKNVQQRTRVRQSQEQLERRWAGLEAS